MAPMRYVLETYTGLLEEAVHVSSSQSLSWVPFVGIPNLGLWLMVRQAVDDFRCRADSKNHHAVSVVIATYCLPGGLLGP